MNFQIIIAFVLGTLLGIIPDFLGLFGGGGLFGSGTEVAAMVCLFAVRGMANLQSFKGNCRAPMARKLAA